MLKKAPPLIAHLYTMLVVMVGWVFFQTETLIDAWLYLEKMFTFRNFSLSSVSTELTPLMIIIVAIAILFSTPLVSRIKEKLLKLFPTACDNVLNGYFHPIEEKKPNLSIKIKELREKLKK